MINTTIQTLGELKKSGYISKRVKDEIRDNLILKIQRNEVLFSDIHGYKHTVEPQIIRALLAGHNINFLGLRGQGKTRMARHMTHFLDEYIPAIDGCEIMEDPLAPITRQGRDMLSEYGDSLPIRWIHRSERFFEKLATPDVSIADLIGDIDPIKAANERLSYSDERVIHFGMIPRAHRCIFVINELPDLQPRIQVALFNALEEGDVQIRGFKLRMNLDTHFVFTANPEDYTQRGSIVTPLKDRIGSQIFTHYPDEESSEKIYQQEMKQYQPQRAGWTEAVNETLNAIIFLARKSEFIDQKSGVSVRLGITARELLHAAAEERCLINSQELTAYRPVDFMAIIPAVLGKVELVYEGEQMGAEGVAEDLIYAALHRVLEIFELPSMEKIKSTDETHPYNKVVRWFEGNQEIQLDSLSDDKMYRDTLNGIPSLYDLIAKVEPENQEDQYFLMEAVLWALCYRNRLSREVQDGKIIFFDTLSGYLN